MISALPPALPAERIAAPPRSRIPRGIPLRPRAARVALLCPRNVSAPRFHHPERRAVGSLATLCATARARESAAHRLSRGTLDLRKFWGRLRAPTRALKTLELLPRPLQRRASPGGAELSRRSGVAVVLRGVANMPCVRTQRPVRALIFLSSLRRRNPEQGRKAERLDASSWAQSGVEDVLRAAEVLVQMRS